MKSFCFVLMPFGLKPDENNRLIDFDRVYAEIIEPAVMGAELDPIRVDKESIGGEAGRGSSGTHGAAEDLSLGRLNTFAAWRCPRLPQLCRRLRPVSVMGLADMSLPQRDLS